MRSFITCFVTATLATASVAQDSPNTILVLDGSGSMWGQIDDVAKITIAQEVVSELLSDFPADEGLGLTVYGHRERGNCTDIETIVAPAPGTADEIVAAVNGIKPLGKTPMTDAVIAAAEALRYTEDSATVILVSDGVETCNPDPCAAARLLEEAGIDFTAHVVGFDVSDPEALAQMQCIAEETGGQFLTADTADELDLAMASMVMEPAPVAITGVFEARIGDNAGLLVPDPIIWDIRNEDGVIVEGAQGNPFTVDLFAGATTAAAYRIIDELEASATVDVTGANDVAVTVIFPEIAPTATVSAPETAVAGSTIPVDWTGPDNENDQIIITAPGETRTLTFAQTDTGTPANLRMPPVEGTYDIHYLLRDGSNEFLASTTILVTPATATLNAPDTGAIGSEIAVEWTGPDYQGDMILMAQDGGSSTISPVPTSRGNPATLTLPITPGMYEIRYRMQQGNTILATKQIEVTPVPVTIIGPEEAPLGATIQVGWDGPDNDDDYIGIGKVGAEGGDAWDNYAYTRDGNPISLLMPPESGDYLIGYFDGETREMLGASPITLTPVDVTITAPTEAIAGEDTTIAWVGPDYSDDYLGIGLVGAEGGNAWENYSYTRDGDPLTLRVPPLPGDYEISYFLSQDRTKMATVPITVTDVLAEVSAPAEAIVGSGIEVTWSGPDYDDDYIGIGKVGATGGNAWESYTYTREGSPATLTVPAEPGEYVITYFVSQDRVPLATTTITLTEAEASVTAPAEAIAGADIQVSWNGPGYDNDYIGIGKVGASGGEAWENYIYVQADSEGTLQMPIEPGEYVISYFLQQDRVVVASTTITLTKVEAGVTAPETAPMGSTIAVDWTGPDYDDDYIGIGKLGETGGNQWQNYAYTQDGSPASLLIPAEPGDYMIRYFAQQDRTMLASTMITVTDVKAQLVADATATAGTEITVGWDGPDYENDYIAIGRAGATGGDQWETYAYTQDGNPVTVRVPEEPGDYLIKYFIQQDRVPIAAIPLTVE
ncbi:VWA domain-containing protein [Yoonia sp. I 8.24]|uniref:VWA domain-containing protein n=1 Tax=Yoonia sp. I 8.24 TaxID=1537229 RepID=UPI001EDE30A6|nr:VWA domain-containing protein [Yoonia sp. I 8.24]MCG3267501.1 VWA domain-containing protein [Yoonia sp. I 8.24]